MRDLIIRSLGYYLRLILFLVDPVSSHFSIPAGLFHRAIVSSGSATNTWAIIPDQNRFNQKFAKKLGASKDEIEDPAKRVQFLRSVNAQVLSDAMFDLVEGEVSGYTTVQAFKAVDGQVLQDHINLAIAISTS